MRRNALLANVVLYPARIKMKLGQMNDNLNRLDTRALFQLAHLHRVASSESRSLLSGKAWDTAINYVENVQIPLLGTYRL